MAARRSPTLQRRLRAERLPILGVAFAQTLQGHGHFDEANARNIQRCSIRPVELGQRDRFAVGHAECGDRCLEVHVLRREEQALKIRFLRLLRQHVEYGAAVVVQQHDGNTLLAGVCFAAITLGALFRRAVLVACGVGELPLHAQLALQRQGIQVVLHGQIARDQRGAAEAARSADGR